MEYYFSKTMNASFDEAIQKVTGAFIANMIKQIEIQVKLNPESNLEEYADSLIKLSHKGFYEEYKENFELGFN